MLSIIAFYNSGVILVIVFSEQFLDTSEGNVDVLDNFDSFPLSLCLSMSRKNN